ncbi:large E1B [Tree shrew adenovirus 1]|uniref:E1B 55 kDa protein n=1 Tax=Tree shrew adenovirus serotype 1 TaxID=47680 RepID=A0A2U9AG73_ADET1|nr:large E1B [Tree shrew adenovirus 1]
MAQNNSNGVGEESPAKRRRLDQVTYSEICADFRSGSFSDFFLEKYNFAQVLPYKMQPDDDWTDMIAQHAKIELDPTKEYVILSTVFIQSNCYIIGHGAKIVIVGEPGIAFKVLTKSFGPVITNMWAVSFTDCVFQRRDSYNGKVFTCASQVLFHNCFFVGFTGTCITSTAALTVRGCQFLACYRPIMFLAAFDLTVKHCVFDKCVIAISTEGDFEISSNLCTDSCCFLSTSGTGIFSYNSIVNPFTLQDSAEFSMVTCADAKVQLLHTIHIHSNPKLVYPQFLHNVLLRAKLFVGRRRGGFHPHFCSLKYSLLTLAKGSERKVNLSTCYPDGLKVYKVLNRNPNRLFTRLCECDASHQTADIVLGEVGLPATADPTLDSVDCLEFSSDEEW